MSIINMIIDHKAMILGAALAISEALAFIPGIKANGIFQAILGFLMKEQPKPPAA